jgi:putative transposase
MTKKAHRIRLNPTPAQEQYFLRAAGAARFTWNWALNEYKAAKARGEMVDWNELKKRFNALKGEQFPWLAEVTKCAPEQALADLRQAINTYYKAKPANPKLKFPGVRKRSTKIGGFGLNNDKFSVDGHTACIPKLGDVNMAEALRFEGKILSGRVTEKAGRWYLTITVECATQPAASPCGSVGIDFGLSSFATLSTGEVSETQAHLRQSEVKLKKLQRGLARKKKGSRKRAKWKLRLARQHERISNQHKDFLHKFTTAVVAAFAVICIEDLNLKGLCQTRLAKSFHAAGIGEASRQLKYKTSWLGTVVQRVGRFFASSRLCSVCGWKYEELTLAEREWDCAACGAHHHRDFNAAVNIELEGLRLLAQGSGYVRALNSPVELATST